MGFRADQSASNQLTQALPLSAPSEARARRRRRRSIIAVVTVAVVLLVSAPIWLGYFGPSVAAYAHVWRPWRTHIVLQGGYGATASEVDFGVRYSDPWPGPGALPGEQWRSLIVKRTDPLLPWTVTGEGTGP